MMRISGRIGLVGVAVGLLSSSALSQQVPTVFMQIVEHNGTSLPNLTTLNAAPGDEIVIDVLAKQWSPSGEKARSYEVSLDLNSIQNNQRGRVSPKRGPRPCTATAQCSDIDGFSVCVGGFCSGSQPDTAGVLVDLNRTALTPPEYIFNGLGGVFGGSSTAGEFKIGFALTNDGLSPLFVSTRYLGTFVLIVSDDACGQFNIALQQFPTSTLNDLDFSEPIAAITGGACASGADCSAGELCLQRTALGGKFCVTGRTEGVTIRTGICTCTGVEVDGAGAFVADPPSCAVDARQPREPDGSNAAGYNSMQIKLDCDDATDIVAQHQISPVFTLREVPAPDIGGNFVTTVTPNVPGPGWVTVEFDQRITEAVWTCVDVEIGANLDSVCVGSLPGDSDASLTTNTMDILAVRACAIDPTGCDPRQCDLDRSGTCTSADLLRSIDLVNGGDSLGPTGLGAPQGWDGSGLVACPEIP